MMKIKILLLFLFLIPLGIWISQPRRQADYEENKTLAREIEDVEKEAIIEPVSSIKPIPVSKTLDKGNQEFQTFNNCGPSALSMALSHYGIFVSQSQLGKELRPYQQSKGDNDDKSVSLEELAIKAEEFGFVTYHRPAGSMEIVKQLIALDLPVITRTWLKEGDGIGHYRVIKGYDDRQKQLIQDDSLQGANLSYSYEEYERLWQAFNFEFLVLVPKEKIELAETALGVLVDETAAWEKALLISESQLVEDAEDVYAKFNKSVALYHLGRYSESIAVYEEVEQKLPWRMLWYQVEPVLAYYQAGKYDRVIAMTEGIINNHNKAYSELYYLRGLIYQKRGETNRAREEFELASFYNGSSYWKSNI